MAYPLVKYNSSTGSDTAPSDSANNSTDSGVTASGSASGTTITFSSSVDLSACADDDSDWMWCETTAGGIHLFRITAFTTATDLTAVTAVTVEPPITANFSGAYWHVNGTRQSLDADNSTAIGLDGNQWRRGWTVELDGTFEQSLGLNLCERETASGAVGDPQFVLRASPSATTKPIVRTTSPYVRTINLLDFIQCYIDGIQFESNYGSTTDTIVMISAGGLTMTNCSLIANNASHTGTFVFAVNGTFRGFNCYLRPLNASQPVATQGTQQLIMDNCWIDCRGTAGGTQAIECETENAVITNTLITESAGDGIVMNLSTYLASQGYWFFKNNTIADCSGDGIVINGTASSTTQPKHGFYIVNNIFSGNGGWGMDLSNTSIERRGNDVDWNAFYNNTSGAITGKDAGANDITLTADPFTDAANDDYSLNNTAGGGALLRDGARYDIPTS